MEWTVHNHSCLMITKLIGRQRDRILVLKSMPGMDVLPSVPLSLVKVRALLHTSTTFSQRVS